MGHSRAVNANNPDACFIGVDFGTLSGRALLARARDGAELGTAVHDYRFGGEIPVGPFALIGSDEIGCGIVATLSGHRPPAVLMRSHGVFAIGPTARAALKAAVMREDAAHTVHLARAFGDPLSPIPQDQIDALYRRYQEEYGQR